MELPKAINELEYGHGSAYGPEEEAALVEVLQAGAPSCGPKVKKFEESFAAYCGSYSQINSQDRGGRAKSETTCFPLMLIFAVGKLNFGCIDTANCCPWSIHIVTEMNQ